MDPKPTRPNVLFVICDQLRADHVGFAGNPVVRTPNIDRIAAEGTVFDRAFVNNPVCMPNRSTIMTGLMPSAHGVIFNDRSLEPHHTTFVSRLRDEGWHTALVGKGHLQHGESRDAVRDLGTVPGRVSPFGERWDTIEHHERYELDEVTDPEDYYGFAHVEFCVGHGATVGAHHYRWAREKGVSHELLRCGLDPTADIPGRSPLWWQLFPAPYPEEISSTSFVTERTIDVIEGAEARDEPWMVWCSYPDPHHPLAPPEPWYSRHDPADIELPTTYDDPGHGWPAHLEMIRGLPADANSHGAYVVPFGPTPEQAQAAIAATYGMVEAIDHGVGRILATLERLGTLDDTIIVFTSDHGDMMGDHGLIMKLAMHFEGCLRVPLVVRTPGGSGQRTSSLAAGVDLPATLLDLCGVAGQQGMQGTSLVPVLDDPTATVRDQVLVEDDFPSSKDSRPVPIKTRTLVTEQYRFTRDSDGFEMLYDLDADPDELDNLSVLGADPALRSGLVTGLADAMLHADDLTRTEPVSR
ncbi:MAG: sulfatase-like hydrolase/transferase [Acidimicrobiales bacterium]|nr:sulfatase-like hydrolase/transferase [Acidimicrobiales bacterium]